MYTGYYYNPCSWKKGRCVYNNTVEILNFDNTSEIWTLSRLLKLAAYSGKSYTKLENTLEIRDGPNGVRSK